MKNTKYRPIQPVNVSKYPARTKQEARLISKKPFGDKDKDRVPNMMDCKPMNKKKQDGFGGLMGGLIGLAIVGSMFSNNRRRRD